MKSSFYILMIHRNLARNISDLRTQVSTIIKFLYFSILDRFIHFNFPSTLEYASLRINIQRFFQERKAIISKKEKSFIPYHNRITLRFSFLLQIAGGQVFQIGCSLSIDRPDDRISLNSCRHAFVCQNS